MAGLIEHYGFTIYCNRLHDIMFYSLNVKHVKILSLNVKDSTSHTHTRMAFFLQFEDTHTVIIACSEVVQSWMTGHYPISVSIFTSLVNLDSAIHIPNSHCPVLRVRQKNLHSRMENDTRDIVIVTFKSLHLPVLVAWETPELDVFVISSWGKYFHSGMEGDPSHPFFVSIDDVLHFNFGTSVKFVGTWTYLTYRLFFELMKVPNADSLIKTAACYQCIFRMKGCTHNIMTMSCKYCNSHSILPVPDANSLIVGTTYYPRELIVKFNSSNVV